MAKSGLGLFREAFSSGKRLTSRDSGNISRGIFSFARSSSLNGMLKPIKSYHKSSKGVFAIVASQYNAVYVDAMVKAAKEELTRVGAKVEVIRVPGAFEIPVVAGILAKARSR